MTLDLVTTRSVPPSTWGPSLWTCLHALYMTFPTNTNTESEEERLTILSGFVNFIHALRYVLPCQQCRQHFEKFMTSYSLQDIVESQESFGRFLFQLEQDITPTPSVSFELWKTTIENQFVESTSKEETTTTTIEDNRPHPVVSLPPPTSSPSPTLNSHITSIYHHDVRSRFTPSRSSYHPIRVGHRGCNCGGGRRR